MNKMASYYSAERKESVLKSSSRQAIKQWQSGVCHQNKGRFALKPDIVIDDGAIIADIKWKLLSADKSHDGVSQADLYQMFAYGSKYQNCENIYLVYPAHENSQQLNKEYQFHYHNPSDCSGTCERSINLEIRFFDLSANTDAIDMNTRETSNAPRPT